MAKVHVVEQGEGISKLGEQYGLFPETIWDHPYNAELKKLRKDGNVLMPGDHIWIPGLRSKSVAIATGKTHTFRRIGVPAKFRLQLLSGTRRRANEPYRLDVDGRVVTGFTDGDGVLETAIAPHAKKGVLTIGLAEEKIFLAFGALDPITELSGVQKRLINIGLLDGAATGEKDARTVDAIRAFQRRAGLHESGELDEQTLHDLERWHDHREKADAK